MSIEQWLRSNTFHHSAFWDLKALVERKEEQEYSEPSFGGPQSDEQQYKGLLEVEKPDGETVMIDMDVWTSETGFGWSMDAKTDE